MDKSTQLHYKFNGQRRDVYFGYSSRDNLPLTVKFGANSAYVVENNYDELTRLRFKTYTLPSSGTKINTSYSYLDWTSDKGTSDKIRTTGTVRGIDYTFTSGELSTHDRWYTYDKAGNILSECVWTTDATKPVRESYTYDSKNQLTAHDSATLNKKFTYAYDAAGNILSKTEYNKATGTTETVEYKYDDSSWHDLLTSYDGQAITYDSIGNPTAYRGWTMSWQGRQLVTAEKGGTTLNYTYDSEGIRTSKTVGSTTTKYLLNGTQILAQKTGSTTLSFFYDQQGNRIAMADSSNHFYYYIYNLQGDVIALADASTGKLAATYTYDAWGKIVKINNQAPEKVASTNIANLNPFRYRGYYYDTETSLYYLQSRYYDPEVGRFINADAHIVTDQDSVLTTNMYAYCQNNPVMRSDQNGESWRDVARFGLAVAAVGLFALAVASTGGGALLLAGVGVSAGAFSMAASTTVAVGVTTMAVSTVCASMENGKSGTSSSSRKGKDYVKPKDKIANKWAQEAGYENAEQFKEAFVPNNGSKFNMFRDKKTGEIILIGIEKAIEVATDIFIK